MIEYIPKQKEKIDDTKNIETKEVYKKLIEIAKGKNLSGFYLPRKYQEDILQDLGIGILNRKAVAEIEYSFDDATIKKYKLQNYYNRIIIPYTDSYFAARSLNKNVKVKNLFPKGKQKEFYYIEAKGTPQSLVICEGETDAIALKHIYRETVDILSVGGVQTKFKDQLHNFLRSGEIWLCFDKDTAGVEHTNKVFGELKKEGYVCKQVYWESNEKDIDDFWRTNTNNSAQKLKVIDVQKQDLVVKKVEPLSKEEYRKIIEKNFPAMWPTVSLCLSLVALHKQKEWTDPVNINLVGPPSNQKTTAASFFYDIEGLTYHTDSFTPKAFVSHSSAVKKEELDDIDMLPRIKDKMLIAPELGPLFSKRKDDLTELIGILTRVFDGEGLQTDSGSQGRRGYTGEYLFSMLGCTTPLPKTAWNIMSKMGSRMFFFTVPDGNMEDEELMQIVGADKTYGKKIKECKEATARMVYSLFSNGKKRDIAWNHKKTDKNAAKVIINCAKMLCKLRASIQVWDDDYKNDVVYESPLIEKPMRIINIFSNIARGHAITEGRNYISLADVWMIPMITASTMPEDRFHLFNYLIQHDSGVTIEVVAKALDISEKVARKTLTTFEVLKILKSEEFGSQHQKIYTFEPEFAENWQKVKETMDFAFPFSDTVRSKSIFAFYIPVSNEIEKYIKKERNMGVHTVKKRESEPVLPKNDSVCQDIVYTQEDILDVVGELLKQRKTVKFDDILLKINIDENKLKEIIKKLREKGDLWETKSMEYIC